jgi:hypothetical protein
MFELLILISYTNFSGIPDNIYYRDELSKSSALTEDFIISNYYYNEHYLYSEPEKNLREWSDQSFENNFRKLLAEEIRKMSKGSRDKSKEGIIPDIDLDLNMPRGLSYILGEGGHIEVKGSQTIDLKVEKTQHSYAYQNSYSGYPQIILEQRLLANINGTIGTKLNVAINHDSEKSDQDNKLRIWYGETGVNSDIEDDIIQELHLGDIGGVGNEKTFGIATRGKFGSTAFDLSVGKLESDEVSGTIPLDISTQSKTLNEYQYLTNEYFYTGLPHLSDSLIEYGLFYPVGPGLGTPTTLLDFRGDTVGPDVFFLELENNRDYVLRYFLLPDKKTRLPYFHILNKSKISEGLGVYLIYADSTRSNIDTLGTIVRNGKVFSSLTLYELKSETPGPTDTCWYMQMRNIYPIGTTAPSEINVEIYKIVVGGNNSPTNDANVPYAEVLGVVDANGNVISTQILGEDGCLVFPEPFPFLNPGLGKDTVPEIYREKPPLTGQFGENFDIVITTTATSSSATFYLGGMAGKIIENSERLSIEGRPLVRNTDYTINYNTGEVELKNKENLPPDAKVDYTVKSLPYFSFESQYQAKANIRATPFKDSKLDFDFGFLSRSDKGVFHPTVGREPSNITSSNLDFYLRKEPEFLSELFSNLPFVDDDSKSGFTIDGSYGVSLPDPARGGKSYLEDMESINLPYNLDLLEGKWYPSSQPDSSVAIADLGKLDWFNSVYLKSWIFPEYYYSAENRMGVLVLYFQPNAASPASSWGGMTQAFFSEQNFSQKDFLEIWVKGEEGELIFDMGKRMVEDAPRWGRSSGNTTGVADSIIYPNGRKDTEDKNGDGIRQTGEDTGLDGVEMDDNNWTYQSDPMYDDGVDDCYGINRAGTFTDSLKRHNMEGNLRLDSEDLNWDNILQTRNDFFRYRIDLSSPKYLEKVGANGWKVFRIPLKDSSSFEKIGNPSLESILYTRIWFTGFDTSTRITLARVAIVGNKWRNKGVRLISNNSLNPTGGYFEIGYKNTYEDNDYTPPVELERDIYANSYKQEQSLTFSIDSLNPDNYCLIENYLELPAKSQGIGYDFCLYNSLNFYTKYIGVPNDSARVFLRLVMDSLNYYQFSTYASDAWDTVEVVFENFTSLKLNNDTASGDYSLKGKPSLKNIAFLQLGVVNESDENLSGEILIDDIILKGADNRRGDKIDLSVSTNIGDLITNLSYNISHSSANYKRSLNDLRSLGDKEFFSQGFGITADLGKFLNGTVSLPVSFNTKESSNIPFYEVNSDVVLPSERADSLKDRGHSRNIILSLSKRTKSNNWLLKNTIDNMSVSGSHRESENFNPLKSADTTTSSIVSANYKLQLPAISFFGDKSTSFLPTNFEFKTTYEYKESQQYNYKDSLYDKKIIPLTKQMSNYAGLSYKPIPWIDMDYSITTRYDLRGRERFSENPSPFDLGHDASLKEDISVSHRSSQFGINNLNITYRNTFDQNHDIEYAKSLGDPHDVRGCSQQRTIRINNDLRLNSLFQKIPVLSRFSKNVSPLKFAYNFGKDGRFAYLNAKPNYKFRYGLSDQPEEALFEDISNTDGGTYRKNYSISSGLSFSRINIDLKARLSQTEPDAILIQRNPQAARKTTDFTFPDLDIRMPDIQKYIPFLGKLVRRSSLSLSINRDSSATKGIDGTEYSAGDASLNISPALELTFKNDFGLSIRPQYSTARIYPATLLNTYRKTKGLSINGSYTLKPSKNGLPLPLFGRVKWDKPINFNASINYKNNLSYTINSIGTKLTNQDDRTIDFNLNGNYSFSDMVSGGLVFTYRNYLNRRTDNMSSTSFGGGFNVILKF